MARPNHPKVAAGRAVNDALVPIRTAGELFEGGEFYRTPL